MKPVTDYIQTGCINNLVEKFGAELEQLDRDQKLQLRITLTYFIWGRDQIDGYSLQDAYEEALGELVVRDLDIDKVFGILENITTDVAEALIEALQVQCRYGNARLKTAVETMTDTLVERGVPSELAKTAAIILREIDPIRDRTALEQEIINKIHQLVIQEAA